LAAHFFSTSVKSSALIYMSSEDLFYLRTRDIVFIMMSNVSRTSVSQDFSYVVQLPISVWYSADRFTWKSNLIM